MFNGCARFARFCLSQIPEPYALLAMIYHDGGKNVEALMFYKLACARDTKNWGNHQEVARIAGILGDHTSRLEALKVQARLRPNDLNVAIERARCLLELQKPKQVSSRRLWGFTFLWFTVYNSKKTPHYMNNTTTWFFGLTTESTRVV